MGLILKFKDYIFGGVVIVLLLALAYVTFTKNSEINHLKADKAAITRDLRNCEANGVRLEAGIQRQNAAIENMRVEGQRRVNELERIAEQARRASAAATERANGILSRRGTGNACTDSEALILEVTR